MIVSIVTFRLWRTKTDAEACYTEEWIPMVTSKYGAPPAGCHAGMKPKRTR